MMKHILVISQYFYPEQFRINDICKELDSRGYKVTVLTGIPNYPDGSFFEGYGWTKRRKENWNGIEVIRIPLISRGHSAIRLVLNYYSFVFFGWFWCRFTSLRPDFVFSFEVSPMTQVLLGKWFSKRRKIPHYAYIQDLWPENLEIVGGIRNKFILNHYERMTNRIYKSCTKILTTSPSFVNSIQERIVDKEKVFYWPQYAEDFYKPVERKEVAEIPDDGKFKIVFTGNIGFAQGLDILPKVAKLVSDNICFVLIGDGRYKKQFIKEIEEIKNKFILIDQQPPERIPELLAACDVAFLSFMNNPLFHKTIPAKLQSYMACGMPILASAAGETKRIIEEAKCGICTETGNISQLASAIEYVSNSELEHMRKNSINYSNRMFNKSVLFDLLEEIINSTSQN